MKILLFLLTLIPMVGIAQPEKMSYQPSGHNIVVLPGTNMMEKELQLFEGENILKPTAYSFLSTADEHKMLIDSSYNFHFSSAIDSSLTSRSIYKYDEDGNSISYSFNYLSDDRPVESYKKEYTFDENDNCTILLQFIWDYEAKQWTKKSRYEYSYDINGRLINTMSYGWNEDGSELNSSKTEKKYDEHGNLLLETSSRYNALSNQWVDYSRIEYAYKNDKCTLQINSSQWTGEPNPLVITHKYEREYDANGNLLSYAISTWDDLTKEWTGSKKDTYSYDTNTKMTNHTNLLWDSNHWRGVEKTDYSYDANGNKILEIISQWDFFNGLPGQWLTYRQTEYSLDSNGNEVLSRISDWDRMSNKWKSRYKYEKIYNDKNLLHSKLSYSWNQTDSTWRPTDKEDYRYNHEGFATMYSRYYWKQASNEWWIFGKSYLYYSVHDLINGLDQPETLKVKLYPNPASELLILEINDPAVTYCQLFDTNGQMVQYNPVKQGVNTFNISDLGKGMYLVKMKAKGETIVKKIIKN